MTYTLPDLPYDYDALEPHYSAKVLELHHDKHHKAYVDGLNATMDKLVEVRASGDYSAIVGLEKTLAFNLSGHVLHSIFWSNLSPDGGDKPTGELAAAIDENFGSFDQFKDHLSQATDDGAGLGLGLAGVGHVRRAPLHRADLRPPGQRRPVRFAAAGARRLGARLLPAVPERAGRLRQGDVEHRQLGGRGRPVREGASRRRPRRLTPRRCRPVCVTNMLRSLGAPAASSTAGATIALSVANAGAPAGHPEPGAGVEPATYRLQGGCSTS